MTTALTNAQLEALGLLAPGGDRFTHGGKWPPPETIHPSTAKVLVMRGLARVLATGAITITDAGRAQYEKAMGR